MGNLKYHCKVDHKYPFSIIKFIKENNTYTPIEVHMREFVGQSLNVLRLQIRIIVNNIVVRGTYSALANGL